MEKMKLQSIEVMGATVELIEDSIINIIELHTDLYYMGKNIAIPKVKTKEKFGDVTFEFYATDNQFEFIKKIIELHYDVHIE